MITVYPYEQLGHADHGWLDARYHFSFSSYVNPQRMRFGALRVINDDIIKTGAGFDTHPHRDMEIITYVRRGAITHRDNQGNEGRTAAGDVQVMSAGTGIAHSEHNLESIDTNLFQIWIEPNKRGVTPRWDAREFPKQPAKESLPLLVAGDGEAPLFIYQDAKIYGGRIAKGTSIRHPIHQQAYLLVSDGQLTIDAHPVKKGDGAEIINQPDVTLTAVSDAEVLVIDVPAQS